MSYVGWFSFGDFSLKNETLNGEYNFACSTLSQYDILPQLYDEYSVPGRSGTLLVPKQKLDNMNMTFKVAISAKDPLDQNVYSVGDILRMLQEQSIAHAGYQELRCHAWSEKFRLARLKEIVQIDEIAPDAGAVYFKVTFDCKPQLYLDSGNTSVTISSGGYVINPCKIVSGQADLYYTAYPLIRVTVPANTAVDIVCGDGGATPEPYGIHVAAATTDRVIVIDTETGHAYNPTVVATSYDSAVSMDDFPRELVSLTAGKWSFTLTGVSSIRVTPRWWQL